MTDLHLYNLLLTESGLPIDELFRVIDTAPLRYKTYLIDKRDGGKREIAQPARELKALQYVLARHLLSQFPVHDSATAYESRKGIKINADRHSRSHFILKMDFESFFHSIKPKDWASVAINGGALRVSAEDIRITSKILFWGDGSRRPIKLSIGAPTSPKLSNIIMYGFDCIVTEMATRRGLVYTRYADDITASGSDVGSLIGFEREIRSIVESQKNPRLTFNEKKRGIYGPGQRRMVTGLVITPNGKISIGRDRKRLITAMVHSVKTGIASGEQILKTKGYLAFAISAEPGFVERMRNKYGSDIISFILSFDLPERQMPD